MMSPSDGSAPSSNHYRFVMTPLAAAVLAALDSVMPALAQEEVALEEITVTATKREMNMQDLGQSITVLSTADIEKQAMQGMEDYIRALPGVSLWNIVPGRNSVVMRGMSTGTEEFFTDSQVAVYLDEQPITTISQQVDVRMIDIARVEVLPGPQGTLFGSSSQAGTLRIVTNRPDPTDFSGQVDAALWSTKGGEESYDLSGWVNAPLIDDKLAVRAVAYTSHEGGYVDNVFGTTLEGSADNASLVEDDYNEFDNVGGRIAARWLINDNWDLDLSYIRQQSDLEGAWESDPALGDYKFTKFFKEYREDDWYQVSTTLKGDLGFAELTATASYFDRDIVYEWDNAVYLQWKDAYWGPYYDLYNTDYKLGSTFNDQFVYGSAFEARLTSQGESGLQWLVGAYYEDWTNYWFFGSRVPNYTDTTSWQAAQAYACYYSDLGYDVQCPLPPTDIAFSLEYKNSVTQKAVFAEFSYDLTERWSATVGVRWFEFDRDAHLITQFPQGLPPFGSFDTLGRVDSGGVDSDTVFKLGTTFHFTKDIMAYAQYSEGFRLGGSNSPRAAATGLVPLNYKPDKVENYEAGMKSRLADGRVTLNVIGFNVVWDQIQTHSAGVNNIWWLGGTVNGGKAENKGVEISADWQLTDSLFIQGRATLSDPKFTEPVEFPDGHLVVPAGAPMVWSAEEKYFFGLEYTIADVLGGDLWFRYDYSYESEKWSSLFDIVENTRNGLAPSWSLSNAQVGLTMENSWEVRLIAKNVWDQKAINGLYIDANNVLLETFGDPRFSEWRFYSRPRTVGVWVTKRFAQ